MNMIKQAATQQCHCCERDRELFLVKTLISDMEIHCCKECIDFMTEPKVTFDSIDTWKALHAVERLINGLTVFHNNQYMPAKEYVMKRIRWNEMNSLQRMLHTIKSKLRSSHVQSRRGFGS